jgi:hypothetical protein
MDVYMMNEEVEALLEKYKFEFRGKCACLGPSSRKYKYKEYTFYWSRIEHKVTLKKYGTPIASFKNQDELEELIKKNVPDFSAEV